MNTLFLINHVISMIFLVCYCYQYFYIPIAWFIKPSYPHTSLRKRYAVLICARNEEAVIGDLIDSLHKQTYPSDLISIFVMADNCTDHTASICEKKGAHVYKRHDEAHVGKGYALHYLLSVIWREYPGRFDGFFVFDADNILKRDYI